MKNLDFARRSFHATKMLVSGVDGNYIRGNVIDTLKIHCAGGLLQQMISSCTVASYGERIALVWVFFNRIDLLGRDLFLYPLSR
jgi:hypothetical protein